MVATVAGANAKATIMAMLTIAATLTPTTNALLGRYLRNETPPGFERPGVSGLGSHYKRASKECNGGGHIAQVSGARGVMYGKCRPR